jgi:3-methyladenine DNA glycosylase/8-oxoguanine DNA glycosylase
MVGAGLTWGRHDPCARWIDGSFWFAARTPLGPASIRLAPHVEAHGAGADWLLERAAALRGELDDLTGFEPHHPLVKRLAVVRLPRTGLVFPRLLRAICEQKVTGKEAHRAYQGIMRRFGEPAPGPAEGLRLPPSPEMIHATPYYEFHSIGLEQRRADVLRRAAFEAPRLESCVDSSALAKRLLAIPGIGPWTVAEVTRLVFGDADAVSVGDYHMKNIISWALAGEPRGTDERMLELLEPYRGHRGRVCVMIEAAGIGAPRFGPRVAIRDFRSF